MECLELKTYTSTPGKPKLLKGIKGEDLPSTVKRCALRMSTRVLDSTHATLESVMKRVPRKGAKATYALSILSRLDWVLRQCRSLTLKAQCLASARGLCIEGRDSKLCDAKCASIAVLERQGELVVYRRTGNPLAVRLTPEGVVIARRGSVITVTGARIKVELVAGGGGRVEREARLDDVEELLENEYLVKQSLKGIETQLSNIIRNLADCARLTATPCP